MLRRLLFACLLAALLGGAALVLAPVVLQGEPVSTDPERLRRDLLELTARAEDSARRGGVAAGSAAGGAALAAAIRSSRTQALAGETLPVPGAIRAMLTPCFPTLDLRQVRWKRAARGLTLGSVLARWYLEEGAVALGDVIVFTNHTTAANPQLWAHELTHVLQYQELGIDGFARAYTFGSSEMERQASDNARHVMRAVRAHERAAALAGEGNTAPVFSCQD